MAKVVIAFDRDLERIGTTEDVSDEEAAVMVRQGRARYAPDTETEAASQPESATAQAEPAETEAEPETTS